MKFFSVFGGIILLLVLGIDFNNGANATEGKNSICKELCEVCDEYFPTRLICYENLLQHICLDEFSSKVEALNTSDLCVWDKIKWPYDSFTKCTEEKADCLKIPWPNQLVEDMFVDIHATHFKSCPVKEFDDPPPDVPPGPSDDPYLPDPCDGDAGGCEDKEQKSEVRMEES